MSKFQENLRAYREKSGITAKNFAAKIGINYTTYTAYENQGREPKYDTLIKIADALHVSIDDLLGYKQDRLQYWMDFLGDKFDYLDSTSATAAAAGIVTLQYWLTDDIENGDGQLITANYRSKEELTAILETLGQRAKGSTAETAKKIMCNEVIHDMLSRKTFSQLLREHPLKQKKAPPANRQGE